MGPKREARETLKLKGQAEKDPERERERCSQRVRRETRNFFSSITEDKRKHGSSRLWSTKAGALTKADKKKTERCHG